MTALVADLMGQGFPAALSNYLGEENKAVTAVGTAQKTDSAAISAANQLYLGFNTVTTDSGQTAVQMLCHHAYRALAIRQRHVCDNGAVYPPSGCTIQGQAADAPASVAQNQPVEIFRISRTAFIGITALVPGGGGGTGTVTSVTFTGDGTVLSSTPSSAVTTSGTLTAALATHSANTVLAGPTSGGAVAPTFRALVGGDLPNPSASTLGGTQSKAVVASNFLTGISTSGVVSAAQPAFTDISGTATAAQLPSNQKIITIPFIIDGGGSAITTGIKGDIQIDFNCTITANTLLADQSGSIVVDIWKDTYANYPPTGADSICASAKPTISSATKSTDSTLTGWTTSITAGDTLRFNVDSITTCTRVLVSLKVTKT